jgi:hypothetical protein
VCLGFSQQSDLGIPTKLRITQLNPGKETKDLTGWCNVTQHSLHMHACKLSNSQGLGKTDQPTQQMFLTGTAAALYRKYHTSGT